jgi:sialic acid synthase SpsE/D-lyxose ketol-isomerase
MIRELLSRDVKSPLFVFDLANNHQGDFEHARKIIESLSEKVKNTKTKAVIKFQYRDLETYIHKSYADRDDLKYITRFKSTRLKQIDLENLAKLGKSLGLYTMTTPFDETSVDLANKFEIDILKIASASADDLPLIKKIVKQGKPIIASTGGLKLEQIDRLVRMLENSNNEFAIMHCVSIYPTPDQMLNLNQIAMIKERYPNIAVGWSTHEDPKNLLPVSIATALGASIFERHVGMPSEKYSLNEYSSSPEQIEAWLVQQKYTAELLGAFERPPTSISEFDSLSQLKRGVYSTGKIMKGQKITPENSHLAFPSIPHQIGPSCADDILVAKENIAEGNPILEQNVNFLEDSEDFIPSILLQVRGMLSKSRTAINSDAEFEISHHYGLSRFREFGAILITCINRDYAKKIVVQLPRQKHPYHLHNKKEETFQLLWGDLELTINGTTNKMKPGDAILVRPGEWHKFQTLNGAVVEEISTTSLVSDSVYEDPKIKSISVSDRKTQVLDWHKYFGFIHELR